MPIEVENQVYKLFYNQLEDLRDHTGARFLIDDCGPSPNSFYFYITPPELVKAFDDANTHTFALIEEGLLQLKDLLPSVDVITVVIGGGSAQGTMWMARMDRLCNKHQIDQPIYLFQIDHLAE